MKNRKKEEISEKLFCTILFFSVGIISSTVSYYFSTIERNSKSETLMVSFGILGFSSIVVSIVDLLPKMDKENAKQLLKVIGNLTWFIIISFAMYTCGDKQ